ncbi:hypothetical protein ACWDD9_31335 [Kitasatospora sp. NPDC001119]
MTGQPKDPNAGRELEQEKPDDQRERRVQMVGAIVIEALKLAAEIFRRL